MRFTEKSVKSVQLPEGRRQHVITDDTTPGFQIVLSKTARSYAVQGVVNGRNKRLTIGSVLSMSLDEARLRALAMRDQMSRGVLPEAKTEVVDPRRATLSVIWDDMHKSAWWQAKRKATQDLYALAWRDHIKPWGGQRLMVGVRLGDLIGLWNSVTSHGRVRRGIGRIALILFKRMWSHAARHGFLGERPPTFPAQWLNEELPGWSSVKVRTGDVSDDELRQLWSGLHEDSQAARVVLLLMLTGMRSQEAAGLRWREVDFGRRIIRLPRDRTKTHRDVNLPITDAVMRVLTDAGQSHMPVADFHRYVRPEDFVFETIWRNRKTARVSPPTNTLARLCREAGVERKTPHMLRKTYSRIAHSVVGIEITNLLTSHAIGPGIVERHYLNVGSEELRAKAELVVGEIERRAQEPREGRWRRPVGGGGRRLTE